MRSAFWPILALALICGSAAYADPPPATAPPYRPGVSLQPVAIYDKDGNPANLGTGAGGGGDASAVNQQAEIASLGTDGSAPPTTAGTGVRGWLRAIYEKITGTLAITATSLPLPSGAATAANQGAANTSLGSIDTKTPALVNGRQPVDGSGVTQPISAASLPLPAGAATAANQATANASLASMDAKTPALVNGRQPVDTGVTPAAQTTAGALQPPTAAAGKIIATSVALTANTSTQLVAANDQRIAIEIQCDGTAIVGISRTGATLTNAAASPLVIPTGSYPLYTMPIATLTALTAYTGTAQTCRVTEYLR